MDHGYQSQTKKEVISQPVSLPILDCLLKRCRSHNYYFEQIKTIKIEKMKFAVFASVVASAAAFAPASVSRASTALNLEYGEFDGKLWDNDAKKVVYEKFDPNAPRTVHNFNPFETWEGNSPDASGFYPGEKGYKDPQRGDVSYAKMLIEREEIEERLKNPKPGYKPGCPGCRN